MAPLYRAHVASLGLDQHLVAVAAPDMPQAFGASAPTRCPMHCSTG
ncbi:MAG: hypothetical protein R3E56_10590 [Burkholderiaceae bacterium]